MYDKEIVNTIAKLPPQAVEVEQAVLGALMLSSSKLDTVVPILKPEIFYRDCNQRIFAAIQKLYNANHSVDLLTVTQQLKKDGELSGDVTPYYLTELTRPIASDAHIEHHVRIITQMYIKREIISRAGVLYSDAFDETADIFELIGRVEKLTSDLNKYIIGKDYDTNYAQLVEDTYQDIINKTDKKITGIDTGSEKLNKVTGGWQNTDLIIIAARPSVGKTTREVAFLKAAALSGKKCALFTLEMSGRQIIKKQLSEQSSVFGDNILQSNLSEGDKLKLIASKEELKKLPIYINDKPQVSANYIRAVCKERKKKYGLDIIFIDYLQLMKPNFSVKGRNREQEVSDISSSLKAIAKEFNIPVVVASQLNREVDKRTDKRPILSDLRESGSLEQDADMVIGLYRPSKYYRLDKDPDYKKIEGMTDDTYRRINETWILKHRNGKADCYFEERFYGEISRFETATETIEAPQPQSRPENENPEIW